MDLMARLQTYVRTDPAYQSADTIPVVRPWRSGDALLSEVMDESASSYIPIFACSSASFCPAAHIPKLELVVVSRHAPRATIQENLDTNARGFDPAALPTTETEAEAFRTELITNCALTVRLNDHAVSAGMFTPPRDGIAELKGITTLAPYRGRGIGAALTSALVRLAFAHDVDLVLVDTDNQIALRMYQRLGFQAVATFVSRRQEHTP